MASIKIKNLVKNYGTTPVVHGINLDIISGEFVVFVGPSGCGKSTTLRMIAGLEEVTSGEIWIGDKLVNDVAPKDRDIAMVFQNYALYPHMSVYKNLEFSLKLRKMNKKDIEVRVNEAAEMLELKSMLQRKPGQLSGGQRQRVAMGRAIVRRPKVFLFDEPLSNLDAKLRNQMRVEIKKLHFKMGSTIVYVTHDQVEAMTLADRIVVMKDGIIQQVGSPLDVYRNPANTFVAGFIGSPPTNFIEMNNKIYGVRPEHLHLDKKSHEVEELKSTVDLIEPLGGETLLHCLTNKTKVIAKVDGMLSLKVGAQIPLYVKKENILYFDKTSGVRL